MRKRLLLLALLLAGGAIVNFAVAWGFAALWRLESNIGLTDRSEIQAGQFARFECHSGLPYRSLQGQVSCVAGGPEVADGLFAVGPRTRARYLPYHLLWPGFAINTVFYAAILWLLFAALFALRRRRRIKRGLCPACAYPVGSSERCTECGARLPAQFRAAE